MNPLVIDYAFGVAGSIGVEIANVLQLYRANPYHLPEPYTHCGFWVLRILFALLAGMLPVASGVSNHMTAVELGASAQVVLLTLQPREPPRPRRKL